MGIFSRLTDIINSNLNAILDRAEDPEKIIRLMIQEMEDTLVEVRSNAARLIAQKKENDRQLRKIIRLEKDWDERAELALEKEREDLARAALVEKSKLIASIQALREEQEELDRLIGLNEDDISKLQTKLSEAKAKQQGLTERHRAAGGHLRARRALADDRIHDALKRFDSLERKVDDLESRAESYDLGGRGESVADQIAALEVEGAVEGELDKLRQRLAAKRGKSKPDSKTVEA